MYEENGEEEDSGGTKRGGGDDEGTEDTENGEKKWKIRQFFKKNMAMLSVRRLTTDENGRPLGATIAPMHKDNIRRLKKAYRHPFEKIPKDYFELVRDDTIAAK
jgi:hypothetical protein